MNRPSQPVDEKSKITTVDNISFLRSNTQINPTTRNQSYNPCQPHLQRLHKYSMIPTRAKTKILQKNIITTEKNHSIRIQAVKSLSSEGITHQNITKNSPGLQTILMVAKSRAT